MKLKKGMFNKVPIVELTSAEVSKVSGGTPEDDIRRAVAVVGGVGVAFGAAGVGIAAAAAASVLIPFAVLGGVIVVVAIDPAIPGQLVRGIVNALQPPPGAAAPIAPPPPIGIIPAIFGRS
jgi:hypothetical protein